MRILVISDIHGNLEGLDACLAAARTAGGYDRVFNLGDIVGYGASPNEVVARSRELGGVYVRGNHDKACSGITDAEDFNHIAALAAFWTKQKLNPENILSILEIKSQCWKDPGYRRTFSSSDIYDAVLEHGVKSLEEFREYLLNSKFRV